MYIDEASNCELLAQDLGFTRDQLAVELERTINVMLSNVTTGVDLGYWIERERVLNALLD